MWRVDKLFFLTNDFFYLVTFVSEFFALYIFICCLELEFFSVFLKILSLLTETPTHPLPWEIIYWEGPSFIHFLALAGYNTLADIHQFLDYLCQNNLHRWRVLSDILKAGNRCVSRRALSFSRLPPPSHLHTLFLLHLSVEVRSWNGTLTWLLIFDLPQARDLQEEVQGLSGWRREREPTRHAAVARCFGTEGPRTQSR